MKEIHTKRNFISPPRSDSDATQADTEFMRDREVK